VFGGDGLGASESGGEQSVVSEEIDFAWQADEPDAAQIDEVCEADLELLVRGCEEKPMR